MGRALKTIPHVLLFAVALVVFYIGLFMGLQANPNVGTLLWPVSAAIVVANILWIVRSSRGRPTR